MENFLASSQSLTNGEGRHHRYNVGGLFLVIEYLKERYKTSNYPVGSAGYYDLPKTSSAAFLTLDIWPRVLLHPFLDSCFAPPPKIVCQLLTVQIFPTTWHFLPATDAGVRYAQALELLIGICIEFPQSLLSSNGDLMELMHFARENRDSLD